MAGFSITVKGQKQLERKFKSLIKKTQTKVVRKAVRAGANVVLAEAKKNASGMVGGEMGALLARKLQLHVFKKQKPRSYGIATWLKSGELDFLWVTQDSTTEYIPAAIEFGHNGPALSGGGRFVAAIPFMRTAIESKKSAAIKAVARTFKKEIEAVR